MPGTTLGSVHYFSPEQARGAPTTPGIRHVRPRAGAVRGADRQRAWSGDTTDAIALARIGADAAVAQARSGPRSPPRSTRSCVRALAPRPGRSLPERRGHGGGARARRPAPVGREHHDHRRHAHRRWRAGAGRDLPRARRGVPVATAAARRRVRAPRIRRRRGSGELALRGRGRAGGAARDRWRRDARGRPAWHGAPGRAERGEPGAAPHAHAGAQSRAPTPEPTPEPSPEPTPSPARRRRPCRPAGSPTCARCSSTSRAGLGAGRYAPSRFEPAFDDRAWRTAGRAHPSRGHRLAGPRGGLGDLRRADPRGLPGGRGRRGAQPGTGPGPRVHRDRGGRGDQPGDRRIGGRRGLSTDIAPSDDRARHAVLDREQHVLPRARPRPRGSSCMDSTAGGRSSSPSSRAAITTCATSSTPRTRRPARSAGADLAHRRRLGFASDAPHRDRRPDQALPGRRHRARRPDASSSSPGSSGSSAPTAPARARCCGSCSACSSRHPAGRRCSATTSGPRARRSAGSSATCPSRDCLPPDATADRLRRPAWPGCRGCPRSAARERAAEVLRHVGLYEERYRPMAATRPA